MLECKACEATHDLRKKGCRIRTRCIVMLSWPLRAAEFAMREYGTLVKREKSRRSTSGFNMWRARA